MRNRLTHDSFEFLSVLWAKRSRWGRVTGFETTPAVTGFLLRTCLSEQALSPHRSGRYRFHLISSTVWIALSPCLSDIHPMTLFNRPSIANLITLFCLFTKKTFPFNNTFLSATHRCPDYLLLWAHGIRQLRQAGSSFCDHTAGPAGDRSSTRREKITPAGPLFAVDNALLRTSLGYSISLIVGILCGREKM